MHIGYKTRVKRVLLEIFPRSRKISVYSVNFEIIDCLLLITSLQIRNSRESLFFQIIEPTIISMLTRNDRRFLRVYGNHAI